MLYFISLVGIVSISFDFSFVAILISIIYVPLALTYSSDFSWRAFFSIFLIIIFFVMLFYFGQERITLGSPFLNLGKILAVIIYIYAVNLLLKGSANQLYAISSISICIHQLISVVLSQVYFSDGVYGRGYIFDVFYGQPVNSPLFGVLIAASLSFWYLLCQPKSGRFERYLVYAITLISFNGILYIGSRTGLIILVAAIALSVFRGLSFLRVSLLAILGLFLFVLADMFGLFEIADVFVSHNETFNRGMESPRFEMWSQGFSNIWDYPYGGLSFTINSYGGEWFHNIFLDTVRTSGYIPMLVLLLFFLYGLFISFTEKRWDCFFCMMLLIALMSADVIVEGGGAIRVVYLFCMTVFVCLNPEQKNCFERRREVSGA